MDLSPYSEALTLEPGRLRIATCAMATPPMSVLVEGEWQGYEPAVARAVGDRLGLTPVWCPLPLPRLYPELSKGGYDVLWYNQTITQERRAWADFTRSYGRFDTAVLVLEGSAIETAADLAGQRVGILQGSTNLCILDQLPPDVETVSFDCTDQVRETLLGALLNQDITAIVEDELLLMAVEAQDPRFRVAFSVPTQRPFGIGVLPGNRELLEALNHTLNGLITDGTLAKLWAQWIPYKGYPF